MNVNSVSSFQNAISQANNGGNVTILIADGTYQVASTASYPYLTGSNVVIRSLSGNRDNVILTGGGMLSTSSTENGILVTGNNVTIADLTIREVGNHGIQVSGHNLLVHNVKIQNTYEQLFKGSTSAATIDSAIVQCSLFEYTAGIGPQWYIGGLDIHKANGWTVRDNIFKNIISPSNAVAEHAVHFWDNSANNVVERNQIINCDRGIGFGLGSSPNTGGTIRNNMIYNNGSGIFADVGIGLESSPNTDVYNNTIQIEYDNAIEYRFAATANGNIQNNLTNKLIKSRDGGTANVSSNVTNAIVNWYSDVNSGNLRLASSIPSVVDQGLNLSNLFQDDLDKNLRPNGASFDIGAHEYIGTTGMQDHLLSNKIKIYPNPSNGLFTIQLNDHHTNTELFINDSFGQTILFKNIENQETQVDVSDFTAGIYFVRIEGSIFRLIKR